MSIWQTLPKPFLMLAPLEGVADTVLRQIVASCAKPDVFVTEFTSAEGFCSVGKDIVSQNLQYSKAEEPIVVQLWGKNPDSMRQAAGEVAGLGFAGIDINMGCPDRSVVAHGSGAKLIESPETAKAVIQAAKEGIHASGHDIPLSVKTRIGFKKKITEEWISFLLEQGLDALTVHGRTAAELSKVPAHWDEIAKAVAIRDRMKLSTVIIGNGDVKDTADAMEKVKTYSVDGVMIGRGIFSNMWAFDRSAQPHIATPRELLEIMERHIQLFTGTWGDKKHYPILKKFFKIYVNGFYGATEWRVRFMATNTAEEALAILEELRTSDDPSKIAL
jgi:tRNA-dihydrouridine synthase